MKTIVVVMDFKHGPAAYYAGETRRVTESEAGYFIGLGWAREPESEAKAPNTDPVTLKVQNSQADQAAAIPGVK